MGIKAEYGDFKFCLSISNLVILWARSQLGQAAIEVTDYMKSRNH